MLKRAERSVTGNESHRGRERIVRTMMVDIRATTTARLAPITIHPPSLKPDPNHEFIITLSSAIGCGCERAMRRDRQSRIAHAAVFRDMGDRFPLRELLLDAWVESCLRWRRRHGSNVGPDGDVGPFSRSLCPQVPAGPGDSGSVLTSFASRKTRQVRSARTTHRSGRPLRRTAGLNYATASGKSWPNGGSPTSGFLKSVASARSSRPSIRSPAVGGPTGCSCLACWESVSR